LLWLKREKIFLEKEESLSLREIISLYLLQKERTEKGLQYKNAFLKKSAISVQPFQFDFYFFGRRQYLKFALSKEAGNSEQVDHCKLLTGLNNTNNIT
jgi:hypothetical protein